MVTTRTPLDESTTTPTTVPVEHMPPLVEVPEGHPIPEAERITPTVAAETPRDRTTLWMGLGILGLMVLMLAAAVVVWLMPVSTLHMGLSDTAWNEYRTGERAVAAASSLHMGLSDTAWTQYRTGERTPAAAVTVNALPGWTDYRAGERTA